MKKKSILAFAIIAVVLYWVLDAYSNVVLYHSALGNELLLKSSHAHPFFKIIIALLVGGVGLMPLVYYSSKEGESQALVEDLDVLRGVSEILFSSLSTKVNVIGSLEKLETLLSLHSVILFIYQKERFYCYDSKKYSRCGYFWKMEQ